MERGERLKIVGNCNPGYVTPLYAAFIGLLNDRITDWTPEQAEAVAHVIEPDSPTQSAIAATLGISPQALSSRLAGARWPTIRRLLQEWESPHSEGAAHD